MALNYKKLGHLRLACTTLALGLVATGIDVIGAWIWHATPGFSLLVGFGGIHRALRDGSLFDAHTTNGGEKCSSWSAAAVVAGILAVLLVLNALSTSAPH
jgi:hypothetical protein